MRQIMSADVGFKNKSVIVTGSGSGIGRAAAIQFAKQGAKVLVAEFNEKTAGAVVDEIRALGGNSNRRDGRYE
jgi:NAD(P)-dependent dehydrogenase (short-subunit alcohol dehydrogenase family)